jgi:hypothetical protein
LALSEDRRPRNVADDEQACRRGTRALGGKQSRPESAGRRVGATKTRRSTGFNGLELDSSFA